jgi:hypothetical protein
MSQSVMILLLSSALLFSISAQPTSSAADQPPCPESSLVCSKTPNDPTVTQLADLGDGKSGASIYVDRNTAAVNIGDVSYSIDWTYTPDCVPKDGARFAGFLGHYIGWAVFGGKNRLLLTSLGSGTIYELDPNKKGSALHEIAQPIYNAAVGGGSGWNGWNATSCPNTTVGAVWGQGSASEVF